MLLRDPRLLGKVIKLDLGVTRRPPQVELPAARAWDIDTVGINLARAGVCWPYLVDCWGHGTKRMSIDRQARPISWRSDDPENLVVWILSASGVQRVAEEEAGREFGVEVPGPL